MLTHWLQVTGHYLQGQLQTNNFLSGAALGGLAIGLLQSLRARLQRGWQWLVNYFSYSLTIYQSEPIYREALRWMVDHQFDRFARQYRLTLTDSREPFLGPSRGNTYYFRFERKWIRASLGKEEINTGYGGAVSQEYMTLSYRGWSNRTLRAVVEAFHIAYHTRTARRPVIRVWDGYWSEAGTVPEGFGVILPEGLWEEIHSDAARFFGAREWYHQRMVPYRRGYLLYGPPGTGKTSLVRHLAAVLNRNLYIFNGIMLADSAFRQVEPGSIVLIEDADCLAVNREEEEGDAPESAGTAQTRVGHQKAPAASDTKTAKLDLNRMLNAMDGVRPLDQVLIIMTTNYPEKLDPALIRPGRIDWRIALTYSTVDQVHAMFHKFFPEDRCQLAQVPVDITPADVQEILLRSATAQEAEQALATFVKPQLEKL